MTGIAERRIFVPQDLSNSAQIRVSSAGWGVGPNSKSSAVHFSSSNAFTALFDERIQSQRVLNCVDKQPIRSLQSPLHHLSPCIPHTRTHHTPQSAPCYPLITWMRFFVKLIMRSSLARYIALAVPLPDPVPEKWRHARRTAESGWKM